MTKNLVGIGLRGFTFLSFFGNILVILYGGIIMAQSKAKKKRLHLKRTQGKDVEKKRQTSPFSTHERVTKTKRATLEQNRTKHRKQPHVDDSSY